VKKARIVCLLLLSSSPHWQVQAGEVDVVEVRLKQQSPGIYSASVTLKHNDQGWKHFANRWEILDLQGNLLATRVLAHPHSEQPFTRQLTDISIPDGVDQVRVRGHDLVHNYGGVEKTVAVPRPIKSP
jgi:hypothetical protein